MERNRRIVASVVGVIVLIGAIVAIALVAADDDDEGDAASGTTTTEQSSDGTEPKATSTTRAGQTTTTAGSTGTAKPVRVYLFKGEDLAVGLRRGPGNTAVARAAIEELLDGPNGFEADIGYTTSIPAGTRLLDIAVRDKVATIDLSKEFGSGGGTASMQGRVAQVVFTATQFPTVDAVRFRMDGKPVEALGGEGVVLAEPQRRADWFDLLPEVLVESPAAGTSVESPLRVTGISLTFEATWRLEVVDGDGIIIVDRLVTDGGGSEFLPFDQTVSFKGGRPGLGAIVVSYESPEDGSRVVVAEIPVRL